MQGLALMVPLAAIGVALGAESASYPAAACGIDSCLSANTDSDDAGGRGCNVSQYLIRQVDFATRAGIDPITVVVPSHNANPSWGRDLVYAGNCPPPRVGPWRYTGHVLNGRALDWSGLMTGPSPWRLGTYGGPTRYCSRMKQR